jgi:hypothetical protein
MPKILLLADENSLIDPIGSKENIVTSRDPLPIQVKKYFLNENIESILSCELENENLHEVSWVILFKDSLLETQDVIDFCEKNEFNLLILKDDLNINKKGNHTLIHNYYLSTKLEICNTVLKRLNS